MFLDGSRVVDWSEGLTAPFAARVLADLGAEVIKVERPGGDPLRRTAPFLPGGRGGALFAYVNAGKRSVALDTADEAAVATLRELLSTSDILIESQPDGAFDRLGLAKAEIARLNPGLVMVSVTPFGRTGPARDGPASDLTLQHRSGLAWHHARPVNDPAATPPRTTADREGPLSAGVAAAVAALAGLIEAGRTGRGTRVDFSVHDYYAHLLFEAMAEFRHGERRFDRERKEFKGAEVAGGLIWILPCADGWVMASPREQHQWDRWMELLGRPAWAADASLCGDKSIRKAKWAPLQALMSEWTRERTRQEIFVKAQAASVPCFPVSRPADLLDNEQLAARRFFDSLGAGGQAIPVPGLPFLARTPGGDTNERGRELAVPALGEANGRFGRGAAALGAAAAGGRP